MKPMLSVLICTVVGRESQFEALHNELLNQAEGLPVEVLFEKDNKEVSVGYKRQTLLIRSTGAFVAFIDDDDMPAPDYIQTIVDIIKLKPDIDCIGLQIECSGTKGKTASASIKHTGWYDNKDGFDYVRTPYHKTPIRRDHALEIGFKDMRFGEDYDYSLRLQQSGLLKEEHYIYKVMYYYRYKFEHHTTKYGIGK